MVIFNLSVLFRKFCACLGIMSSDTFDISLMALLRPFLAHCHLSPQTILLLTEVASLSSLHITKRCLPLLHTESYRGRREASVFFLKNNSDSVPRTWSHLQEPSHLLPKPTHVSQTHFITPESAGHPLSTSSQASASTGNGIGSLLSVLSFLSVPQVFDKKLPPL